MKCFWIYGLLLTVTTNAMAGNNLEDWIRRLTKPSKNLVLTSSREESPALKITPKLISFKGVVKVPSYMRLSSGSPKMHGLAGQLIIDGQIICNYSPRSNNDRYYVLQECSDRSRSGDKVEVQNKIQVKLNFASSDKASLTATVQVVQSQAIEYGINFPYMNATEGQILMYSGEAWVAADVSELNLASGVKGETGDKGDQGEAGAAGPQGPAGVSGAQGIQGEKGLKGDAGPAGVAGAQGAVGETGAQGAVGATGAQGAVGATGAQGAVGATGAQGAVGAAGVKGDRGETGATGAVGLQGPAGANGVAGNDGAAGAQGDRGNDGATGPQGSVGATGPAGADGLAGAQGPAGATGAQGIKGDKGDRGLSEIAYLRDERVSGSHGGSCAGTIWNPRSLNVLGGDISFISLANNRFVLQPGKYFIEVSAPASATAAHQAKLKVVETGADALIGSASFSHPTSQSTSLSIISGELIIATASTFEVQHRCGTEKLFTGLGQATSFGTVEIYTQVKIIKKQ